MICSFYFAFNLIKQIKPVYPQIALTARIQGVVIIEAMTDIYGRVRQARVISGHPPAQ